MKIVIVGATGTVGKAVVAELAPRHEIIQVGKSRGQYQADIKDADSIRALFGKTGKVDAIVSTAGKVHFGPLAQMTPELFAIGLHDKLLGQVQLALIGVDYLNDGGSITLTSGVLGHDPIRNGANASAVNGGIDSFVKAAAIELLRGIRINSVSATVLVEAMDVYGPAFRGFAPVPGQRVALAYSKSVEGAQTGQIYSVL